MRAVVASENAGDFLMSNAYGAGWRKVSPLAFWPCLCLCLVWLLAAGSAVQAQATPPAPVRLFVGPQGDDLWSGRSEQVAAASRQGPLRTWSAAQAQVRQLLDQMRRGLLSRRPVQVVFLPGEYMLDQELHFSAADSGEPDAPVSFVAQTTGTVRVSGGKRLSDGGRKGSAVILTGLPRNWRQADPGQLYVAGRRAILARQPNAGQEWFVAQAAWLPGETGENIGKGGFIPSPEAQRWLAGLSVEERQLAIVNLFQSWANGFHHLAGNNTSATLQMTPPAYWPARNQGKSQRFHIENVLSALDAPGEWVGENNLILYLPRSQETQAGVAQDAVLAMLDRLVVFDDSATGALAHDIRFEGLIFEHSRQSIPATGLLDIQAAVASGAAIEVNRASRVIFDACTVRHAGGYGIWFRNNVRESKVLRSTFEDLGSGGIKFGPVSRQGEGLPTGTNEASNNIVQHTGQVIAGATGIWVGASWDNLIRNNLIAHTTYSAISVGWKWGFGEPTAGRNLISDNLIFNIGEGLLADLGGIYTLGPSPGTVISGNVIREVRGYKNYGAGAWGIYNDEGSSQILTENNVVIGTDSGAYHLNYGHANMIRSNLFAGGQKADIRITKGDPTEISATFENNLIDSAAEQAVVGNFDERNTIFRANRFSAPAGLPAQLVR
jgi:Right handed beta helix region